MLCINSVLTENNWDTLVAIFYFYITSDRLGFLNTLLHTITLYQSLILVLSYSSSYFSLLFIVTYYLLLCCVLCRLLYAYIYLYYFSLTYYDHVNPANPLIYLKLESFIIFIIQFYSDTDFGLDTFCEPFASVPSASIAPSEVDCQPYVEKAIKELVTSEPIGS